MTRLLANLILGTVLVALASACVSGADEADDQPLELSTTADLGAGFTVGLPEGWELARQFGEIEVRNDGCVVDIARIRTNPGTIEVGLVGAECSSNAEHRGNGEAANFSSADQLAAGDDIETLPTDLGTLTIATVDYFECTNECEEWAPSAGVIELDEPADPAYPALMLINDYGSTHDQIRFLAENLSHS